LPSFNELRNCLDHLLDLRVEALLAVLQFVNHPLCFSLQDSVPCGDYFVGLEGKLQDLVLNVAFFFADLTPSTECR
jgi:hypothetical protein